MLLRILPLFVLLPLLGFLASLFIPPKNERSLSALASISICLHLVGLVTFTVLWAMSGFPTLDVKYLVLYQTTDFEFFIDLAFDRITAVFSLVGSLLLLLVSVFSRYYMHRDSGFKRFFNTLLLFALGYHFAIFSGNFETLFVGWEVLGITSFLLIAFYRDRYLPVKNGFKVLSFYRFSDVCLMLAMWMCHHLWHRNITFAEMNEPGQAAMQFQDHYGAALFVAIMVVLAAAVKSAQAPFFTWLPRAMEGPTSSSAIFYGSLSVHIGAFLLLRTWPFWQNEAIVTWAVVAIGLLTSLLASSMARVQPSVKSQIAYASAAQIGLMFIEIALGFHTLALAHFAGNACLRTYQLLVSPSVLNYLTHQMFFHHKQRQAATAPSFFSKIKQAIFVLSVREWGLDAFLHRFLWRPFKWMGRRLGLVVRAWAIAPFIAMLSLGNALIFNDEVLATTLPDFAKFVSAGLGLGLLLSAFAHRGDALRTWALVSASQFFVVLAVLLNDYLALGQVALHLGGYVVAAVVGCGCLLRVWAIDRDIEMNRYHGYSYERPGIALLFFLSCLCLIGFPISPTFIGVDLLLTRIHADQVVLMMIVALNLLFLELTLLRLYTRVFLGQHKKEWHPVAFKSS